MKYIQKPQKPHTIDAYTFPVEVTVAVTTGERPVQVAVGDYLLFVNGQIDVMSKKEFLAQHDPVDVPAPHPPRVSKPRLERKSAIVIRGLAAPVLEQQAHEANGAEQTT